MLYEYVAILSQTGTIKMVVKQVEKAEGSWVNADAPCRVPHDAERVKIIIATYFKCAIANYCNFHSTWGGPVNADAGLPTHLGACCRL